MMVTPFATAIPAQNQLSEMQLILISYFNPLLPGFTGVLPDLHNGQASGV